MGKENSERNKGIFDTPEGAPNSPSEKQDFKDPFVERSDEVAQMARKKKPKIEDLVGDQTLESTAAAVNNAGPGQNVQADLDEMDKFTEEDIKLAEQMIFRGYAEFDAEIPNFPGHKFTICSTSAEELAIIEEVVFDTLKNAEDKDGNVNLPQSKVTGLRNALFVAISYRGMDKNELSDDTLAHLNTIKKAVIKVSDLETLGQLEEAAKLKDSLKKRLLQRAVIVNRLATPVIDFLSDTKYKFDSKMIRILNSGELVPKS